MKMEFSAGGLVYRRFDGLIKFALIENHEGSWTFPKGHIEKQEKPEEAAIRETSEEIGLSQIKVVVLLEKSDYWFKLNEELIHKFVYFYLMEDTSNDDLKPQLEELKSAAWFTPEEALERVDYKKQNQEILKKAFSELGIDCTQFDKKIK